MLKNIKNRILCRRSLSQLGITPTIYALCAEFTKAVKLNFIIGSKIAFFSLAQCISPLIGLFGGTLSSGMVFGIRTFITLIFSSFGIFTILLYHIPTFCGALYLSSNSKLTRICLPLMCIILFILHPTGHLAMFYASYWLIPIVIASINSRSIFLQCLGSTFTTHAFGTIIWLYSNLLDVKAITILSSFVWAERLIFAAVMSCVYYSIVSAKAYLTSKNTIYTPENREAHL